jgi:hypothetical protein
MPTISAHKVSAFTSTAARLESRPMCMSIAAALRPRCGSNRGHGMASSTQIEAADIRVRDAAVTEHELSVALMDGRTITVPLAWYPRLANATPAQRSHWQLADAGYGIHWPDVDEDLSTEGSLLGFPAPHGSEKWRSSSADGT